MQDKLEEFKTFIKDKPYLANEVKEGKISWQTLYETYDLFGQEHEFFKDNTVDTTKSTTESKSSESNSSETIKTDQFGKIVKTLQKVDTKKISDGLDNVKKIVGLFDELRPTGTSSRLPSMRIKPFRRYND